MAPSEGVSVRVSALNASLTPSLGLLQELNVERGVGERQDEARNLGGCFQPIVRSCTNGRWMRVCEIVFSNVPP